MEDENVIVVTNENNETEKLYVIDFVQLPEYDREYIWYTKNEEDGNDVITYYGILNEIDSGQYQIEEIKDDIEANKVKEKFEEVKC